MNEVFVSYNPYLPELKIQVNGRSLSEFSALVKYKHSMFVEWCSVFFDEIAKEVNDTYELKFIGTQFEGDMFEKLAHEDDLCERFSFDIPEFSQDVLERLTSLQGLGDIEKDTDLRIGVWSPNYEMTLSFLEMLISDDLFYDDDGVLISEDCPLVRLILESVQDVTDLRKYDMVFAFFEDYPEDAVVDELISLFKPVFVFFASGLTGFEGKRGNVFLFNTDGEDTTDLFFNVITATLLPTVLSERSYKFEQLVNAGDILLTENERDVLRNICATWPQFRVVFPERMYVGRRSEVKIEGTDAYGGTANFSIKSVQGLCEVEGTEIKAVYPGIDDLRVFNGDDPDPIAATSIRILDRKVIKEIKVFPRKKYLPEGVEDSIDITISPEDAVNMDEFKIDIENPGVVEIRDGRVNGLSVGETNIFFSTPDVETSIQVIVQPHIMDIRIGAQNLSMKPGESIEWEPRPEPVDCFEKEMIRVVSSKDSVVTYREGYLVAGSQGSATIVVSSPDGSIRKECRVDVKKAGLFG